MLRSGHIAEGRESAVGNGRCVICEIREECPVDLDDGRYFFRLPLAAGGFSYGIGRPPGSATTHRSCLALDGYDLPARKAGMQHTGTPHPAARR